MILSTIQTKALDILRSRGPMQSFPLSIELWPEAEQTERKIPIIGDRYHMAAGNILLSLRNLGLADWDKTKPPGFWVAVDKSNATEEPNA